MKPHGHSRGAHAGNSSSTTSTAPNGSSAPHYARSNAPQSFPPEFVPKHFEAPDHHQMRPHDGAGAPNPYKQGGYQYPMYAPPGVAMPAGPNMAPSSGPMMGMNMPRGPHGGQQYRMRGHPRQGQGNYGQRMPPTSMGMPHGQEYYPMYMPPPGGMYMPAPPMAYPPMSMGMDMSGSSNVPVPTQQHHSAPPARREKKILAIVDPLTGANIIQDRAQKASGEDSSKAQDKVEKDTKEQVQTQDKDETKASEPSKETTNEEQTASEEPSSSSAAVAAASSKATKKSPKKKAKESDKPGQSDPSSSEVKDAKTADAEEAKKQPAKSPEKTKKAGTSEPVESKAAPSPKKTAKAATSQESAEKPEVNTADSAQQAEESADATCASESSSATSAGTATEPDAEAKSKKEYPSAERKNGRLTYTIEALLCFRDDFTELPAEASEKWPSMEITTDVVRVPRSRGGNSGGGSSWERGDKQGLTRQSSRAGGGDKWQRSQELPKRGRSERGGRGRGGRSQGADLPGLEGPVKPLERSSNRWIPTKAASNLEAAKKKVQSVMNKMTREKFSRLATQMTEIEMESMEMLQSVIRIIFNKALDEPNFCDMYADLCVHLEMNWKTWSFLKIVQNDDDDKFYWTTMAEADSEVVGPFSSSQEALADSVTEDFEPSEALSSIKICEVRVHKEKFVKIWMHDDPDNGKQYFWSGQMMEDLSSDQKLHGPYDTHEQASRTAIKSCSFKRILLNACQEEFEKDNIYEELEQNHKKAKSENKLTPEMIAEYEEKRMIMKSRMLGNIRFIGELFRKSMLQERIMHECIMKLMGVKIVPDKNNRGVLQPTHPEDPPDEENIESLCKLLGTIGKELEARSANSLDAYFRYLEVSLLKDKRLCSRIVFMIKDLIDLRKNAWQPRRKELKQKTLTEIRKEAEREQRAPASAPHTGRNESFRGDLRRSGSSRDGGFGNRQTMAPVYQSHSMNSRSGGMNKMSLPIDRNRSLQRDDSVKTGPQGRPASFLSARRGGPSSSRRIGSPAREPAEAKPKKKVEPLSDEAREKIGKKSKSIAEEFVSIHDLGEASICLNDLKKEYDNHLDVDRVFAKEILSAANEASEKSRVPMFELLESLSITKKSLRFEGVRHGLAFLIGEGGNLWCDVPKMHIHVADFAIKFLSDSKTTGISLGWIMAGGGDELEDEIYEEAVDSKFLEAVCGCLLSKLKENDAEKAKEQLRSSSTTILALFPSYDRTVEHFKAWLTKYKLDDFLRFDLAFQILDELASSGSVGGWIEKNLPIELRTDPVFAVHMSMLILNATPEGSLPPSEHCFLIMGFLASSEMHAMFISAIIHTRQDSDEVKRLLGHLFKENAINALGCAKWLELKNTDSVGRKPSSQDVVDFVEEKSKAK